MVPLVEVAIAENSSISAHLDVDWAPEAPDDVTLSYTLRASDNATFTGSQLCCTSISWSSTGQLLIHHEPVAVHPSGYYKTFVLINFV